MSGVDRLPAIAMVSQVGAEPEVKLRLREAGFDPKDRFDVVATMSDARLARRLRGMWGVVAAWRGVHGVAVAALTDLTCHRAAGRGRVPDLLEKL